VQKLSAGNPHDDFLSEMLGKRATLFRLRPANEADAFVVLFAIALPAAPMPPIIRNEKLGTFSLLTCTAFGDDTPANCR
jgi:hypothetical protein